jgi:cholesterol oxidase
MYVRLSLLSVLVYTTAIPLDARADAAPPTTAAQDTAAHPDPNKPAVIIIGSGFGGSVAALRLGQSGIKTLVLERGRDWTIQDTTRNSTFATLEDVLSGNGGKSTWLNDHAAGNLYLRNTVPIQRTTGVLELVDENPQAHRDASPALQLKGVHAVVAAGVGGGSLVNNGITYKPTVEGFNAAFPASELPFMPKVWKQLSKRYFELALGVLKPEVVPYDVLATSYYEGTRLMLGYANALGYPDEDPNKPATLTFGKALTPVIADYQKVRDELTGTRVASVIKGEVWWGNNSGARKSLTQPGSYLASALATGNVTVKPLHTVTDISYDKSTSLYTVQVTHTDESYKTLEQVSFSAANVIMAAGSLGTTKLLVRAKGRGTLPKLNEHIGTRWSTNGNTGHLFRTGSTHLPLGQGGIGGVKINDFSDPANPVVLENLPMRAPPNPTNDPQGAPQDALFVIGVGIPTGKGAFSYDASADMVTLDWPTNGADNVYNRVATIYKGFSPGLFVQLPPAQSLATTFHPLGGVPLGLATTKGCQLHGYHGLFVVDGSLMPGAAAVTNPSLLITALAERCMDRIVEHLTGVRGSFDHDDDDSGSADADDFEQ